MFDSYSKLTGGQLTLPGLEGNIENVIGLTEEWNGQVVSLDERIKGHEQSIADYKASLAILQETISDEVLKKSGYDSLSDLFGSGDTAAIESALSTAKIQCQLLGMTTAETALQLSLLQNGFSNLDAALATGDVDGIINDLGRLGAEMGMSIEQINTFAHNIGLIPENKQIHIDANGNLSIIDTAKEKIEELPDEHNTEITAEDKTAEGVDAAKENINSVEGKEVTITVREKVIPSQFSGTNYGKFGVSAFEFAGGTQNAPEGLAVVNDQKGIANPTELIQHDNALYMLPGRNVLTYLSKHDKVYTASQTQAIMRGLGIPHYASGKNNSDAFTLAKDNWNHYTKTHAVTTTQELEKWLEFQEQYKDNEKDIWDIEEQIFSLQQKLYSERVRASEKWLAHETKYNGMSTADYLAGIDRMKAYTAEYYAQGIISHEEYNDALLELDEKYLDKRKEQLEEMYEASKAYISEHTYFNDWSGDDPLSAYNRVKDRQLEALKNGELTQEEYDKYMSELGSTMLSERTEQSKNWLDEQRKYFGMSDEEYVAGLERIKAYTQQYYDQGLIDRIEYNEAMTELNHSMWDEAASAYDEMLSNKQDYISDLRQQFSDEEQALRDSWTVEDRATDIADVKSQLDVYKNAVTDRGQQKYKELQEQMKQLQREEELYQLEVANNAVIEKLEAEYEQLEADKAEYLKGIAQNTNIDVSGIVGGLSSGIQSTGSNITSLLSQILGAFSNLKIEMPTYADNKQVIFNEANKETVMAIFNNVGWLT
ncbi:MAG: hypothetical protein IJX57_01755 [Clostridia bacterium]|nr:hypothetical protein [Clostridia bacterium]